MYGVRLMCALRAHINKSIFGKVLLGIEKVLRAHNSKILMYVRVFLWMESYVGARRAWLPRWIPA